ncbi:MAG: flagellar hook-length control protein FliK [Methylobacterium frigidaeris]
MTPVDAKLTDLIRLLDRSSGRAAGESTGDAGAFGSLLGALERGDAAPSDAADPAPPSERRTDQGRVPGRQSWPEGAQIPDATVPDPGAAPREDGATAASPEAAPPGYDDLEALMERASSGSRPEREPASGAGPADAATLPALLLALTAPAVVTAPPAAAPAPEPEGGSRPRLPTAAQTGSPATSEPLRITVLARETHFAPVQYGRSDTGRPAQAVAPGPGGAGTSWSRLLPAAASTPPSVGAVPASAATAAAGTEPPVLAAPVAGAEAASAQPGAIQPRPVPPATASTAAGTVPVGGRSLPDAVRRPAEAEAPQRPAVAPTRRDGIHDGIAVRPAPPAPGAEAVPVPAPAAGAEPQPAPDAVAASALPRTHGSDLAEAAAPDAGPPGAAVREVPSLRQPAEPAPAAGHRAASTGEAPATVPTTSEPRPDPVPAAPQADPRTVPASGAAIPVRPVDEPRADGKPGRRAEAGTGEAAAETTAAAATRDAPRAGPRAGSEPPPAPAPFPLDGARASPARPAPQAPAAPAENLPATPAVAGEPDAAPGGGVPQAAPDGADAHRAPDRPRGAPAGAGASAPSAASQDSDAAVMPARAPASAARSTPAGENGAARSDEPARARGGAEPAPQAEPAPRAEPGPAAPPVAGASPALPSGTLSRITGAIAAAVPAPAAAGTAGTGPLRILTLRLTPDDLGTVTVRMRLKEGRLELALHPSRAETADLLRKDATLLSGLLREAGYEPDAITVQAAGGTPAQAGIPAQPAAQETRGAPGSLFQQPEGGGQRGGAAPDQETRRQPGSRPEGEPHSARNKPDETAPATGTSGSPGGVYL